MKPFWNKKWGKDRFCAITQSRLRQGKNRYNKPYCITLPCQHSFYRNALIEWIKNSYKNDDIFEDDSISEIIRKMKVPCPVCRAIFSPILLC